MVEKDQKLMGHIEELRRTRETGNLPEVISSNLETVSEEELIEKYKIQDGNSIVKYGEQVEDLLRLSGYVPKWRHIAFLGLVAIIIAIFGMLIFSGIGFGVGIESVFITAANGIAVFFQRLLQALLCLLVGAVIGAVIGVILFLIIKFIDLIWIGAVIGGVIGFVMGFKQSEVSYLADTTQNTVGMGGKIIVFVLALIIFSFIFYVIELHAYVVELLVRIPLLHNRAVAAQTAYLEGNVDYYHIVMRYPEILKIVCTERASGRINNLEEVLHRLEDQINDCSKQLRKEREQQRDATVGKERDDFNEKKKQIIINNRKINFSIETMQKEIEQAEGEIKRRQTDLEKIVADAKKDCQVNIDMTKNTIKMTSNAIKDEISQINGISKEMVDKMVEDPVEIVDEFYWWQPEDRTLGYAPIMRIVHSQKPVLFRYQTDKNVDGPDRIKPIYSVIKLMFLDIIRQNVDLCEVNVIDPVMEGVDFVDIGVIKTYKNSELQQLFDTLDKVIKWAAKKGGTWNSACDAGNGGREYDNFKCQVVFVVIPPEDVKKVQLDSRLWDLVLQGEQKGVIPIFFVNETDYKNYSSEEDKDHSSIMKELQSSIFVKKENMYTINLVNKNIKAI